MAEGSRESARALELELLLGLHRGAARLLANCEGAGLSLEAAVERFLASMVPRVGALAGVARVAPPKGNPILRWVGLEPAQAQALARGPADGFEGTLVRQGLAVGAIQLGELVLLFPDTLGAKAASRAEILAAALGGAVLTLADRLRAPEAPAPAEPGRFGRYTLLRLLGTGGMAEVHLARVDGPGGVARLAALKRMLPHLAHDARLTAMFLDEARVASLINHPHVARVEDFGELGGTYFMAMELLAGIDSADLVDTSMAQGGIPLAYAVALASQVASGLHAAHELRDLGGRSLGLVHRDVSPQNILVTFDGIAKLVDFGVAKSQVQRTRTQERTMKGKLCYMSPEQCLGRSLDRRSDVFALGAVLYEFLSGQPLFLRDNDGATLRALLDEPLPKLPKLRSDVGEELWRVVQRALARNPDERYPTALHLSAALDGCLKAAGGSPSPSEIGRWLRQVFPGREEEIASWSAGKG